MHNIIIGCWKKFGLMIMAMGLAGLILSLGFLYYPPEKTQSAKNNQSYFAPGGASPDKQPETITSISTTTTTAISTTTPLVEESSQSPEQPSLTSINPPTTIINHFSTLQISQVGTYQIEVGESQTAFELLVKAGKKNNFLVEYQQYSFGPFVTAIGGVKAHDNWYWALYYNGKYSNVGAGDLIVREGDTITWRMETW